MGRTVNERRAPTLFHIEFMICYILALAAAAVVVYFLLRWALPGVSVFVVRHWFLIALVGLIALFGFTSAWTVPPIWRAFRAVSTHRMEQEYHKVQIAALTATTQQIAAGFNVEIHNGRSHDTIKIENPYVHGRSADQPGVTIAQVEDLLAKRLELPIGPASLPEIETPRMPHDGLHLSATYNVPADDVLSGRKLFVGVSGSGKSNSVGAYGEELGRLKVPFVLADTEDEYQPLCNPLWLPHGILAGAKGQYSVLPTTAIDFGRFILDNQLQVILNLQSYDMPVAAMVMVGIITGMRQWQEEKENELRIPSDFILEEAVTWLPQNVKESALHGSNELAQIQGTIFNDMVRKGRKRGLGISLVCQRIAEMDKRALQSDTKLLHRQTENTDLELYDKMGVGRDETLNLANGEAFLFTSRVSKMKVQIRKRYSPHGANTPGLENLRRHQQATHAIPETPKYFGGLFSEGVASEESEKSGFDALTEPLSGGISKFPGTPPLSTSSTVEGVPEEIRKEIEKLYAQGMKRTDIQEKLSLNGDEYWMIRDVCNASDHRKKEAGRA